ncbi:hypothetical protein L829_3359 [Mycobacteroides abscessus MAB_030201_1075]|uniref:Glucose-6-phosphate dehydrogenase assembly protein OpcA N-terminal domain-containing protein n=1 Tax=Mycobacteroides abscessus MAB_030201_1075 TaxID=1335410 RepID=A0A829PRJ4_9MYCO|nr:hypothetical protein L829_3359 [Mycobacteroides abscessus MAB_030201_1075]
MIIDLPNTTTNDVNKKLVELRETGGAVTMARVLTLVVITDAGDDVEEVIEAANGASHEHPCRVIVLERNPLASDTGLSAQIRVGAMPGPARSSYYACAARSPPMSTAWSFRSYCPTPR